MARWLCVAAGSACAVGDAVRGCGVQSAPGTGTDNFGAGLAGWVVVAGTAGTVPGRSVNGGSAAWLGAAIIFPGAPQLDASERGICICICFCVSVLSQGS